MVFFYGDDDVAKRLTILNDYLKDFEPTNSENNKSASSQVHRQPLLPLRKTSPGSTAIETRVSNEYPVLPGENEDSESNGHMCSVNWLVNYDAMSQYESLVWAFLNELLVGNSSALLTKALTDSGLGSYVIGGGLSSELIQGVFGIGLKGLKDDNKALDDMV